MQLPHQLDSLPAELLENYSEEEVEKLLQSLAFMQGAKNPSEALSQPEDVKEPVMTEIHPLPGFVVKTGIFRHVQQDDFPDQTGELPLTGFPVGTKVFLNLCHSPAVPAPPPASDEDIQKTIRAILHQEPTSHSSEQDVATQEVPSYRIPLSLGKPRKDTDRGTADGWMIRLASDSL